MTANTDAVPSIAVELLGVAEVLKNGDGFWRSCSGCHETEDGHDVGHYEYSAVLKCTLGGGCSECGGIGAVWDDTDYGAMADAWDAAEMAREQASEQVEGAQTQAARDVLAERQRQVTAEGWTPEHDDEHDGGEMADAAAAYALHASGWAQAMPREVWPADWSQKWWKPTTPRRDLVKAGALIIAEIERLDRAAASTGDQEVGS